MFNILSINIVFTVLAFSIAAAVFNSICLRLRYSYKIKHKNNTFTKPSKKAKTGSSAA
jgi:hypothetical protein